MTRESGAPEPAGVGVPGDETAGLSWSPWLPIVEAVRGAPRAPGVYMARSGTDIVYIGRAGHRNGAGVAGRLRAYATGKSPDSGLIGKAADRALRDVDFTRRIVDRAVEGRPMTLREIATAALQHLQVEVRSAATPDAAAVERELIVGHRTGQLWNIR